MENTPQELEEKPSLSKDLWLFLIVLDVVILCVFGFFLYKYFSARVLNPAPAQVAVDTETQPADALPEISDEEVVEAAVVLPAALPAKEEKPAPVVVVEEEKPAPQLQQAPAVQEMPTKESIVIAPAAANSKYRRVTFKWFEPAEKVAIVSGFTSRQPQALKKVGDHWETTLSIAPGTYKFLYVIDGKNTVDPYTEQKDGRSVVVVK